MNINNIPKPFHWLIPIVNEVSELSDIDDLSHRSRAMIAENMSREISTQLVDWTDAVPSTVESDEFMMALFELDSIGMVPIPYPKESYLELTEELDFPNPGRRRMAVEKLGHQHFKGLNLNQQNLLIEKIESLITCELDLTVCVQCYWFLLLSGKRQVDFRSKLRILCEKSIQSRNIVHVSRSFELLFRISPVRPQDIDYATKTLLRPTHRGYTSGILHSLLDGSFLSVLEKEHLATQAVASLGDDVEHIVEDFRNGSFESDTDRPPFYGARFHLDGQNKGA